MTKSEMLFYKSLAALVAVLTSLLLGIAGWQLNKTVLILEQIAEINQKLHTIDELKQDCESFDSRIAYNKQAIGELKIKVEMLHK